MIEMKDSGVEWIGEIPKSWRTIEIKYYCENVYAGGTPQSSNMNYWNGNIPWIPSGSCHDCKIYSAPKTITKEGFQNSSTKLIPANTALVAMTGATCGSTGYLTFESCANQSVTAYIENSDRANSMFLWFLLQAAKQYLLTFQTGGAQGGVNVENCKNLIVPFIRLETQQRIASYLDSKCSKIDAIIECEQALIEKLKEYKLSVITEAVTKGLNPNVEMKDSGIEWIGNVPSQWNTIRIKWLLQERKERSKQGKEEPLSMSQIYGIIPTKQMERIPNVALSYVNAKIVYPNDLVFNKLKAHLGVFSVSKYSGLVSPDYAVYYSTGISDLKYLEYVFKTPKCILEFRKKSSGIAEGLTRLYTNGLYSIYCPYPSIDEQKIIVKYLNLKCENIDATIQRRQVLIDKLTEYRKSLIYEVVTGKKEV